MPGPVGHKDKGDVLEKQALRVPLAHGVAEQSTKVGETSCPNVSRTELLYARRAGGTHYSHKVRAANYLC